MQRIVQVLEYAFSLSQWITRDQPNKNPGIRLVARSTELLVFHTQDPVPQGYVGSNPTPRTRVTTPLLSLPKEHEVVGCGADVLEARFEQVTGFISCVCDFSDEIISFEVDEMGVDECTIEAAMTEDPFDVENVFRFMVFHSAFEVSESAKGNHVDP